ncbi:MAG: UDP-N-acetylmuramoyl-tripeptide--D-alanyl-D-alanine ligase, partial [Verrucomicrobiota bacterium]
IRVRNTLSGLQKLAASYRQSLEIPVVGITGSSGKTSTKDLTRFVLGQKFQVNATKGNLNNHIGLPLTILDTNADHDLGVFEMGMNHPGEIEVLAEIAGPDVGIITNVGTAHLEFMGTREAIALEKGMLAEAVAAGGCVVLSAHDDFTDSIRERTSARILTGGVNCGDISATNLEITFEGCRFDLSFAGETVATQLSVAAEHMVRNATLAAAAGIHLGLTLEEIGDGLAEAELTGGRLQRKVVGGIPFLDDSYNANPDSVKAALRTLRDLPVEGKRVAVLGLMAELGDHAEAEHVELGRSVVENKIDILLGIGEEGRHMSEGAGNGAECHVFDDHPSIAEYLRTNLGSTDLVLLKGSRSAEMERVFAHLTDQATD